MPDRELDHQAKTLLKNHPEVQAWDDRRRQILEIMATEGITQDAAEKRVKPNA